MMIKLATATIKSTGEQFYYEVKQSWNKLYYSFDGGASWRQSKTEAYGTALQSGALHRVNQVRVTTAATQPQEQRG